MQPSQTVRDATLHFYDRLSASDVAGFDEVVAFDAVLIIGTAPGEWVTDRASMRFGFETEGVRLESGGAAVAYEEGTMGWVADQPTFYFPDGSAMSTRLTAVFRQETGRWVLVHMHVSVGVPDDEVLELQRRWGTTEGG
ncbi:MAG TPA: nuclear transport factor 2 family protein [Acidimicrobiales bacterium]|nr:nuclear transport factor 2 family protein [Acidimicrobiales bacterium]